MQMHKGRIQIKGVGIDPKSLHEIWLQMNILKAEAT